MSRIKTYYYYSQLLIIASLPFHFLISTYAIAISLVLFIIQLFTKSFRLTLTKTVGKNKIALGFIMLFAFYIISLFIHYADYSDFGLGLSDVEKKMSYLIFPLLFYNINLLKKTQINLLFKVFVFAVISSTIIALFTGLYYTLSSGSLYFYDENKMVNFNNFMYHRLGSYVGMHAVYLAEYVLFALVIIVHYLVNQYNLLGTRQKLITICILLYLVVVILLLKSAAILIILIASIVLFGGYYLYKARNQIKLKTRLGVMAIGLIMILGFGYQAVDKIGSKSNYFSYDLSEPGGGDWNAFNLRLAKWDAATIAVSENWFWGVGPGNTEEVIDDVYRRSGFDYALQLHYNPHNQFLHTFLALGVFGLILFVSLLLLILKNAFQKRDIVYVVLILSLGLFSMSESILAVNKGIVFFTLFTCIFSYLPNKLSDYLNG